MTNKISGIYIIINTKNQKVYIGQSQDIKTRWANHKRSLDTDTHYNPYLQRAWIKYGAKSFKFQVLEYCSMDQLNEREQNFLDTYIAKGLCYNIALDATAPMRGRTRKNTEATKQKMSEIAKGRIFSEEHRRNLSKAQKNKPPMSDDTKKKLSEALKGRSKPPRSSETLLKMSESHKGKILSEETKEKMRQSHAKRLSKKGALK